jgi:hypothetical protein
MSDEFIFHGTTTFINKSRELVIHDFQNSYITGRDSDKDQINAELLKLVDLVLKSGDLPNETKEEVTHALHQIAGHVQVGESDKLTLKGVLQGVKDVVIKASDIATPALTVVNTVFKLLKLD